ncbi:hypothetical protein M422DRAFT_260766 [Sphaerobolus stellatus SS14]|uniref:Uncharacterized protein n=1 Tax=Sphaerobolus stellatus (strain SS14) TaxID=990650 RepID=A0A0C9VH86_SPHS4|nr:hypothetical protein M422DRAFT_260766 [Sphaerobolus stellatus SS14]
MLYSCCDSEIWHHDYGQPPSAAYDRVLPSPYPPLTSPRRYDSWGEEGRPSSMNLRLSLPYTLSRHGPLPPLNIGGGPGGGHPPQDDDEPGHYPHLQSNIMECVSSFEASPHRAMSITPVHDSFKTALRS